MSSSPPVPRQGRFDVLMTCGAFEPGTRRGGPIKSAAHIVDTVSDSVNLRLVCSDRDAGDTAPYPGDLSGNWMPRGSSKIFYLNPASVRHWLRLLREVRRHRFDLLYLNSFLDPTFTLVPLLAARMGLLKQRKILVAPRGEMSPGAMSLKSGKKKIYLRHVGSLMERMDVKWHASSTREASDIKRLLPWADVYINQDQVDLPGNPLPPVNPSGQRLRLVFISRISPMKNLEVALRALRGVAEDIDFDIYGPVSDPAYWASCQDVIHGLPPSVTVRYHGELPPGRVRETFARYDAFLFPTLGENFGHVIAESLSASCPVICADTTPWTDLLRNGGGSVIDGHAESSLREDILRRAKSSPADRQQSREQAGVTYRRWHSTIDRVNIIDLAVRGEPVGAENN